MTALPFAINSDGSLEHGFRRASLNQSDAESLFSMYRLCPIKPGTKEPKGTAWQDNPLPISRYTGQGLGVICGPLPNGGYLGALDLDFKTPQIAEAVKREVLRYLRDLPEDGDILIRTGMPPKFLIPFYSSEPVAGKKYVRLYQQGVPQISDNMQQLEVLGTGNQFLAYAVHPGTGKPYSWRAEYGFLGDALHQVPPESLTQLTGQDIQHIADMVERIAKEHGLIEKQASAPSSAAPAEGDSFFAKVNRKAIANPEWFPVLFPTATKYHDGYRVASADLARGLEEDISFANGGIMDFGEETGKTAIDLVLEWGSARTPLDAALWLCERMGINPAVLGYTVGANDAGSAAGDFESLPDLTPPADVADPASQLPRPALMAVDLLDVMEAQPEPVRFAVKPWMPRRHVTLLGGHGGIGKSSLALGIAAHVACGQWFADLEVTQSPVVFVSLEDEPAIVRLRLRKVIEAYQLPAQMVLENMRLLDGTEAAAALMIEGDRSGSAPVFTRAFHELSEAADGAGLIIIDNASDAFAANENARREVRLFIRGLAAIARLHDAALVLLAHIDKSSAKDGARGNSYSGSTAWHNSARSRLALMEQDGHILLVHEKANLSKKADPLEITFRDDVPMPEKTPDGDGLTQTDFDQAEIMRMIKLATEGGITVPASVTPGAHCAMKALENLQEYPSGLRGSKGSKRAAQAIVALLRSGRLKKVEYRSANRKQRIRLELAQSIGAPDDLIEPGEGV